MPAQKVFHALIEEEFQIQSGSQAGHQASQLHDTSGITAIPDHVVEARGTQPGIVL
jgi:hypothetical protein